MKRYIFRLNWNGFYDWCHHVNEAKGIIHTHQTLNSQTKEWHKEEYQEAKVLMETYCIISNKLTEPMKDYLKANINHKTPSRKITMKDMKEAFRIWRMTVMPLYNSRTRIPSNKEIGMLLEQAREKDGRSVTEVAEILHINRVSLAKYENGERKIPLNVFLKLNALYRIKIP